MKKVKKLVAMLFSLTLVLLALIGATQASQAASDQSLAQVKDKGTLVVGTSADYPPYEFLVNTNGKRQAVGMDIEIARKIADDMGVKLVVKNMDFDSLLVALETKKVDMIISGMNPTAARKKSVTFSDVYYTGNQDFLVLKGQAKKYSDYKSFANLKIGVQKGSLQQDLVKENVTGAKITALDKIDNLTLALKSHKIDGLLMDQAVAEAYADNDPTVEAVPGKFALSSDESGYAAAFSKGAFTLADQANKSIAEIKKDGLLHNYIKTASGYMKTNTANTTMLHYWKYFANGLLYTLLISAISAVIGIILGMIFAFGRLSKNKLLHGLSVAYIEFVRGTPLMVQILFVYFGIGYLFNIPALLAGIIAVSLNSAAYVAEIIRSGINSIPKGQTEAARSLGLSKHQTMQSVILPQAIKNIWPALGNEFISLIKESSIVSIIGVTDLIFELQSVQSATYKGVAPIFIGMVLYFLVTFGLSKILGHFERKMQHD